MSDMAESISPEADGLFVAGIRDEASLGWAAAEEWLNADDEHFIYTTVRSDSARDYVGSQQEVFGDERVRVHVVDWSEQADVNILGSNLRDEFGDSRVFSGLVHAVGGISGDTEGNPFTKPAHEQSPEEVLEAVNISAVSLLRAVQAVKPHLASNGGVVTLGFGSPGTITPGYGTPMGTAKATLTHIVAELGHSLGRAEPPARTSEIVTGFVQTRSGRGVTASNRVRPNAASAAFEAATPLEGASGDAQRQAAGRLAVRFVDDPAFATMTGTRLQADGGWSNVTQALLPPK